MLLHIAVDEGEAHKSLEPFISFKSNNTIFSFFLSFFYFGWNVVRVGGSYSATVPLMVVNFIIEGHFPFIFSFSLVV